MVARRGWLVPSMLSVVAHISVFTVMPSLPSASVAKSVPMRIHDAPPPPAKESPPPVKVLEKKPEPPKKKVEKVIEVPKPKEPEPQKIEPPPRQEPKPVEDTRPPALTDEVATPGPAEAQNGTGPAVGNGAMLGESRPPTTNVAHGLPSNVKREGSVLSPAAKRDLQGYQRRIYEAVSRAPNRYPPAALRLGLEGKGKILVRIDRQGRIVSKKILQSTGHQMLDDKAMQTIEEVAPFGPLPDTFELPEVEFVIPVTFRLTDG